MNETIVGGAAAVPAVGVDITSFDSVTVCEAGHSFELKAPDGITGIGVKLIVLGKHADAVVAWTTKVVNKYQREQQIAARKGKVPDPKSLDEIRAENIEGAAVRVIGWEGVRQPFAQDLLRAAIKRNPHWVDQIVAESDDLGNFSNTQ